MNITITLPKADPTDVGIWRAALQQAYDIIMCETAHRDVRYEPVRTLAEALRRAQDTLSCEACGNRGWLVATVDERQRIERCDACQAVYDGTLFVHDDAWAVEQARAAGLVFAKDLKGQV